MTITITRDNKDLLLASKHAPYVPDAENNFDLYVAQVQPTGHSHYGERTVYDFTRPREHALKDGTPWWFPAVPEVDATNAHYLNILDVVPGDVVWDIGAYSGRSTAAFAEAVGTKGRVVALEPDPTNYDCLVKNLACRPGVWAHNLALWDRDTAVLFEADGNQGSGITALRTEHRASVRAITPKTLLAAYQRPPTVVKLDIEGAEYRTVPAFAEIFPTTRPRFLIECHHDQGKIDPGLLVSFFADHDYCGEIVPQPEDGPFPLLHAWPR